VGKAKEILRLHDELGLSQREIAAATGCSLGTVSSTLSKAKAADITYSVEMTAKQLGAALYPPKDGTGEEKHSEPDLKNIHREMQRKGVTLTLLWEEYRTAHPNGLMYTQFCQRYRDFRKQNDVYMRKQYKAGERLETDWAGLTLPYGEGQKMLTLEAVRVLREINRILETILTQMQELATILPEYSVVRSMKGVGDVLASRLIAEIGDVRRFHSGSALVAFAGIDSSPYQSGGFTGTQRRISKCDSALLRKTGYEVMKCLKATKPSQDAAVYLFMLKKEAEGKPKKVAKVAALNKFLRIYYARVMEVTT